MFVEIRENYLRADRPCPLPFVLCNLGASSSQSAIQRPNGFHFHHVLWVTGGEGLFQAENQTRVLGPGQGLFCRRGIPHGYERYASSFSTRWMTFLGGEGALDFYHAPPAFFFSVSPVLENSANDLERFCQSGSTVLSRSAAGYTWLTEWLAEVFDASVSPAAIIRQYLETHFSEPITLEEIGAQVQMDRFSLCRYYREKEGITVMDQLKNIRIAKAKQLLRCASCPIEEVGLLCGYNSPSYFGKIFREEVGCSPREYRAQRGNAAAV